MRNIPKYITDKINNHNRAIQKCVRLEREISKWYQETIGDSDAVNSMPEDEWNNLSFDSGANWISIDALKANLVLADRAEQVIC